MKMFNDCLPCIARGGLDAARLATDDEQLQLKIVKKVLKELCALETLRRIINNHLVVKAFICHEDTKAPRFAKKFYFLDN